MAARFTSAEGKRYFLKLFNAMQFNMHFISVLARSRLDHALINRIEDAIRQQIDLVNDELNQAIDAAEAHFKLNGITHVASFDTQPLVCEVGVYSSFGRRYLELMTKFDQLMPLLQTLEILEVLPTEEIDTQRSKMKRLVRDVSGAARNFVNEIKPKMEEVLPKFEANAWASPGEGPGVGDGSGAAPAADEPKSGLSPALSQGLSNGVSAEGALGASANGLAGTPMPAGSN
jgi:hypothetical protein